LPPSPRTPTRFSCRVARDIDTLIRRVQRQPSFEIQRAIFESLYVVIALAAEARR
jgi:hypothetical protein